MTDVTSARSATSGLDVPAGSLSAPSGLLGRAKELTPLIEANAETAEADCTLTAAVVEALHESSLWSMWTPRCLGGLEAPPVESLEVLEQISYADGSTGWVLQAAGLATGTGGSYLGDEAVERIFPPGRSPVIEGQGTPRGKAVVSEGGFVLSGNWSYGSGVKHCNYIHTGAVVYEDEASPRLTADGTPEVRVFVLPVEQSVFGGNWNVLGLRATGSIDYSIEPTFVPEDYTHIGVTETPLRGGALYTLGIPGFGCMGHAAFAMGVGRRVLDELRRLVRGKIARPGELAGSEYFQTDFASQEAKYRSARAFVYETWRDIEATLARGEPVSTRQKTLARLALNHVTSVVSDVCMFVYKAGGGLTLREGVIQRFFRDMHSGTQHFVVGQPVLRECGRELVGVADDKVWRFMELVDPV
jgi:alkylation response protein AidB-like acyl-CoA dehydrogenase